MSKWVFAAVLSLILIPLSAPADQLGKFEKALNKGDVAAVKAILDKNPKLARAEVNDDFTTPLHLAACDGRLELAKLLISRGAAVNALDVPNRTPLHLAASEGHAEMVRLLISKGAKVNIRDDDDETPLWCAVEANSAATAKLLIDSGAKINVPVCDDMAALHLAAQKGDLEICRMLIESGAKVNGDGVLTPLQCAAGVPGDRSLEVVRYLVEKGADVSQKDYEGRTSLHICVERGDPAVAEFLMSKGAKANDALLLEAAMLGRAKMVELLVDHGASVNARGPDRADSMHASLTPDPVVKGETALELTLRCKHEDIAEFLIRKGAKVNTSDKQEMAGLWWRIAEADAAGVAGQLIDMGASFGGPVMEGETLLHLAAEKGSLKLCRLLIEKGVAVDARDPDKRTPLHAAASYGQLSVARYLVEKGADVNAKSAQGESPLAVALGHNHKDIAAILRKHGAREK